MAYTTPKTYAVGEVLTASMLNTYQRDNITALHDRPYLVPLSAPLTSTDWDGDARSTTAKTKIDLSAVFSVPGGVDAVLAKIVIKDSGSSAASPYFAVGPSSTADENPFIVWLEGVGDDERRSGTATVPCDTNGDIYYQCVASGADTLDVTLEIWGYWTTT